MTITIPIWLIQMFAAGIIAIIVFFMIIGILAFWASFDL